MADTLPRDAWVQSFQATSPKPLFDNLKRRLQASTTHVTALSELYRQRAVIEAQYADSLAKLAKTAEAGGLNGKQGVEWEKSGGEAKLWDVVVTDLVETSSSHSTLSALLRTDFEQPIRDLPSKISEWRKIHDQENALDKTLKDYEKTATKLDKASSKSKSSKADVLQNEIDQITRTLSVISPEYYQTYQRLDEERLKGLKEVIVRWGTVKGDIASRDGERAERTVAGLLGWETGDEVLSVGMKLGGGGSAPNGGANRFPTLSTHSNNTTPSRADRRLSSAASGTSDFSPRPAARTNGSATNTNSNTMSSGGTTGFSGLKSMLGRKGTLAGGRRDSNRGRSESITASTRSDREGGFDAIGEDEARASATPTTGSQAPALPSTLLDADGFSVPPPDRHRALWDEPSDDLPTPMTSTPAGQTAKPKAGSTGFTQNFSESPAGSVENLSPSTTSLNHQQPKLNLALAQAPIEETEEERQAALAKMQQTLQMQPSAPTRRGTVARGRRDVRNTMFAPGGLGTDLGQLGGGSPVASSPVAGGLGSPFGQSNGTGLGSGGSGSGSGDRVAPPIVTRQSSTSSVTSNNPFDSPSLATGPAGGLSASTMAASTEPGLRASMTETINVIMNSGTVSRVQISGEIHLSLRSTDISSSNSGPIHIRLNAFESLEKIAPNPAYLAQVPEKPGEYFLNSEVLANATSRSATGATAGGKGTLLFRYQVHIQPGQEAAIVPLILEPAFSCKEGETRMILNYKPSPSSKVIPSSLSNVALVAAFNPGPAVSNVQTKPLGGVWSPASRRLTWNLGALDESGSGKLIARFTTEPGEAMSTQGVQATWALEGSLVSGLGLEVVSGELEGDGWKFEEIKKGVTTGKYLAEPVYY